MSAPKSLSRWALLAKLEAVYNTFNAPAAATDAIMVTQRPDPASDWMFDGSRDAMLPGTVAQASRTSKSGRFFTLAAIMQACGFGAAYSGANYPSVHTLLRAMGYNVATDAGVGTEKQTYTPANDGDALASLSAEVYARGQRWQLKGGYGNKLTIEGENGRVPVWTFEQMFTPEGAAVAMPSDAAYPDITWPAVQTRNPIKAAGLGLTIDGVAPVRIKSFRYEDERFVAPRALDPTGEHGGFQPGSERVIRLSAVIESLALATMNPYNLADLLTQLPIVCNVPGGVGTQYDRFKINLAQTQMVDAPEQDENNVAMWDIQVEARSSSPKLADMSSIVFD